MSEVSKLRAELKKKEARYRSEMNKESDELEDKMLGYAKNAGLIISVLLGGYLLARGLQGKNKGSKIDGGPEPAKVVSEDKESKLGFSIPSGLTQKLLVGAAQIGLALMTMNVKKRIKAKANGSNTESTEDE